MANLSDDHIRWILDMDAKGVQSELKKLSSQSRQFIDDNRRMNAEIKAAEKQLREAEKAMDKLTKAGKRDSRAFKEAEETYHSAADEITTYRKRVLENTRAIEENNKVHNEIIRTMRIENMTMSQLEQRAKSLEAQLRDTSESAEPQAYAALSNELNVVKNRMGELSSGSQSMFSVFKGGLAVLAGNLMTQAINKVKELISAGIEWVKTGIDMASMAEGVRRAFKQLGQAGLLDNLREQTKGLTSDFKLMESAVKADKYKIPIEQVGNLLEFARRRAVDMGKDIDDFQKRIIEGIGKQSKVILDDLGLSSVEISNIVAKEGSFAKGVIALVNEELEKQGDLPLTAADKAQRASVKWENAQQKVGESFLWIQDLWSELSGSIADRVNEFASTYLPRLMQKLVNLYNWFVDFYNESVAFRFILESSVLTVGLLYDALKGMFKMGINSAASLGKALKAAFTLNLSDLEKITQNYFDNNRKTFSTFIADAKKEWQSFDESVKRGKLEYMVMPEETPVALRTGSGGTGGDSGNKNTKKLKEAQNLALEQLETKHMERMSEIRKKYADGEIKYESDFNAKKFAEEQSYYLLRQRMLEDFIKNTNNKELRSDLLNKLAELQNKQLDQEIQFRTALENIILDANPVEKEKRAYAERLMAVGLFGVEKENMTADQLKALELLEIQHNENLEKIDSEAESRKKAKSEKDFAKDFDGRRQEMQLELNNLMQQAASLSGSGAFEAEMAVHLQRLNMINEEIAARTKAGLDIKNLLAQQGREEAKITASYRKELNKRIAEAKKYGTDIGTVTGNVITGQEDALKAFSDIAIDILFDTLSKIIEAEIIRVAATGTASIAEATSKQIASKGFLGIGTAAILTGLITAAMTTAKVALKGLIGKRKSDSSSSSSGTTSYKRVATGYADGGFNDAGDDGGFTGIGGRYDVAGLFANGQPYHRGEYIVAQPEMKVPAVASMVRAIESVRRQRSTSNPLPAGFADGGYNDSAVISAANNGTQADNRLEKTLSTLNKTLSILEKQGLGVNLRSLEQGQGKMDTIKNMSSRI